jgi:hypothetical protein
MAWPENDPHWTRIEFVTVEVWRSYGGVHTDGTEHWDVEVWGWSEVVGRKPRQYSAVARLREIPGVIVGLDHAHQAPLRTFPTLAQARQDARNLTQILACGRGCQCPGIKECVSGTPCPYKLD